MAINKLKQVKVLLIDVDGVLTDGGIIYDNDGVETKVFNVRDGLGIKLLLKAGIVVGIVTGRASNALHHRCKDLGIDLIFDGVSNKGAILEDVLEVTGVRSEQIAFVGDDLPDLPLLKRVGVSIAAGDAQETVVNNVDMVTDSNGGAGVVREVSEAILKAQGLWEGIIEHFLHGQ